MSLDDAIKGVSAGVEIKTVRMSDEQAHMSVYAPAGDVQNVKKQPAIDMLKTDGLDIQVFVYDKHAPPLKR